MRKKNAVPMCCCAPHVKFKKQSAQVLSVTPFVKWQQKGLGEGTVRSGVGGRFAFHYKL